MRRWFRLGRLRAVHAPIFLHWSVFMLAAICAVALVKAPLHALVLLASILILIVGHELGHALVCRRLGVKVLAIYISAGHGRCVHEVPYSRWEEALIAWGGVAAQASMAIPFLVLDAFWVGPRGLLGEPISILGYFSLLTIAFNLLPVQGLDGSKAWYIASEWRLNLKAKRVASKALRRLGSRKQTSSAEHKRGR